MTSARRSPRRARNLRRCGAIDNLESHIIGREKSMHRRNILATALATAGALLAAGGRSARAHAGAKAVYHLSDLDKAGFVLGNIGHHLEGAGGPEQVTLALVVHGTALRAFHLSAATPDITRKV